MTSYDAQYVEIAQSLAMHAGTLPARLERIRAELAFADRLFRAHPERASDWQPLIVDAAQQLGCNRWEAVLELLVKERGWRICLVQQVKAQVLRMRSGQLLEQQEAE